MKAILPNRDNRITAAFPHFYLMSAPPIDTKIALLVGGLGTRLRSALPNTAKVMAYVRDRPFLDLLFLQLRSQNFRKVVLCTGFRSEDVESRFGDGANWGLDIVYSRESSPLGTAGALRLAEPILRPVDYFVAMNGDSFMELDLRRLIACHHEFGGIATLAVTRQQDQTRYGTVLVDSKNRVTGFLEKTSGLSTGLVNAGIYVFSSRLFDFMPQGPSSLEKDVFPAALSHGVYALEQNGIFIDIGTPEDYAHAQKLGERLYQAATSPSVARRAGQESQPADLSSRPT